MDGRDESGVRRRSTEGEKRVLERRRGVGGSEAVCQCGVYNTLFILGSAHFYGPCGHDTHSGFFFFLKEVHTVGWAGCFVLGAFLWAHVGTIDLVGWSGLEARKLWAGGLVRKIKS